MLTSTIAHIPLWRGSQRPKPHSSITNWRILLFPGIVTAPHPICCFKERKKEKRMYTFCFGCILSLFVVLVEFWYYLDAFLVLNNVSTYLLLPHHDFRFEVLPIPWLCGLVQAFAPPMHMVILCLFWELTFDSTSAVMLHSSLVAPCAPLYILACIFKHDGSSSKYCTIPTFYVCLCLHILF